MQDQVISIGPNGEMSGLQRKAGDGLPLNEFGRAEITRTSLVEWDADAQKWYVVFIDGVLKGLSMTEIMYAVCLGLPRHVGNAGKRKLFETYEDGVKAEIAVLDAVRQSPRLQKVFDL